MGCVLHFLCLSSLSLNQSEKKGLFSAESDKHLDNFSKNNALLHKCLHMYISFTCVFGCTCTGINGTRDYGILFVLLQKNESSMTWVMTKVYCQDNTWLLHWLKSYCFQAPAVALIKCHSLI